MDQQPNLSPHLDALTLQMAEQNSLWHALLRGIFYGVGFVIGSVILAAILIGIFLPFVKDIPAVQQAYTAGSNLINGNH